MSGSLFRKEVMQARNGQWLGAVNLATPLGFAWWAALALALGAVVVLLLTFGHYTRRATVSGQLQPSAGLQTLAARTTGIITRVFVHEGDAVVAGQALAEVSAGVVSAGIGDTHAAISAALRTQATQIRATLGNVEAQATAQAKDLQARIEMLAGQVGQIDGQLVLQRQQVETAAGFVGKIRPAVAEGIVSVVQFNQYQSVALTEQAQLKTLERQRLDAAQQRSNLRAQLTQLPLDSAAKTNQLRGGLAQIEAQLAQSEAERGTVVRAPDAGIVSALLVRTGQSVTAGQSVLSILPQGSTLEAQLLVPSSAVGFIAPGNRVVLRYQAYPYQKFGQQDGEVKQVSRSALSPSEAVSLLGRVIEVPLYRVLVALDRQNVDAYGKVEVLKPGMALDADIMLERRNLWQWVFEPLLGLRQQVASRAESR